MQLIEFDLSTSSDSSVSSPSAFRCVSFVLSHAGEDTLAVRTAVWDVEDAQHHASQSLEWLHTAAVLLVTRCQGFMQDKIIASHTCFGGHMDVNC